MWERFGFYLMLALFMFYLTEHVKVNPTDASGMYGNYMGLVYLTPFFGGVIADRYLGYKRSILIGAALLAIGYFVFALDSRISLYISTGLLIIGNGLFKPNI